MGIAPCKYELFEYLDSSRNSKHRLSQVDPLTLDFVELGLSRRQLVAQFVKASLQSLSHQLGIVGRLRLRRSRHVRA